MHKQTSDIPKHKQKVIKNVEVTLTKHGKQSGPRNGHIKFEKLVHVTQSIIL
jgi:hypothetical protein